MKRRKHSKELKLQVVKEALEIENKTLGEQCLLLFALPKSFFTF